MPSWHFCPGLQSLSLVQPSKTHIPPTQALSGGQSALLVQPVVLRHRPLAASQTSPAGQSWSFVQAGWQVLVPGSQTDPAGQGLEGVQETAWQAPVSALQIDPGWQRTL